VSGHASSTRFWKTTGRSLTSSDTRRGSAEGWRVRRESFLEGHIRAFTHFGGAPRKTLYDNTRVGVAQITGDGERKPTGPFSELQSHCLLAAKFGRPDGARQSQPGRTGA
jgi:transposase